MRDCYILDTNALSELYIPAPNDGFILWFNRQPSENLYTTALNAAEIRYGIEKLPKGEKKTILETWWNDFLIRNFHNRILDFDLKAAQAWGTLKAADRKNGRPRPIMDGLLAAIALANNLGIATRNTKDFAGLDIDIVNPWL